MNVSATRHILAMVTLACFPLHWSVCTAHRLCMYCMHDSCPLHDNAKSLVLLIFAKLINFRIHLSLNMHRENYDFIDPTWTWTEPTYMYMYVSVVHVHVCVKQVGKLEKKTQTLIHVCPQIPFSCTWPTMTMILPALNRKLGAKKHITVLLRTKGT